MKFRSFKINGFDNINIGDYSNVKIIKYIIKYNY